MTKKLTNKKSELSHKSERKSTVDQELDQTNAIKVKLNLKTSKDQIYINIYIYIYIYIYINIQS